ncbi:hypothetical protein V5799_009668 [Amblyomma americanum]|uniref:Secreted protein n=1 Tax=Amblyomma americanum TaxID=6943 RepID=A0AAQ4FBK7_AMBAM
MGHEPPAKCSASGILLFLLITVFLEDRGNKLRTNRAGRDTEAGLLLPVHTRNRHNARVQARGVVPCWQEGAQVEEEEEEDKAVREQLRQAAAACRGTHPGSAAFLRSRSGARGGGDRSSKRRSPS